MMKATVKAKSTLAKSRIPPPEGRGAGRILTAAGLYIYTFGAVTLRFTDIPFADVGIAVALLGMLTQREKFRIPSTIWAYLAFVIWCFLSALLSKYSDGALDACVDRLKLVMIVLILVNALRTERDLWLYLLFFLACFMLYPGRGTLQGYFAGSTVYGRAVWNKTYANPNDLAALCLLTIGMALAVVSRKRTHVYIRGLCVVSAATLAAIILLTQSRGVVIGTVVALAPAILWSIKKYPSSILYMVVALVAVAYVMPTSVWERLAGIRQLTSTATIADADPEGSAKERFEIQKTAWRIFVDHPVFGVGLGAYSVENAIYSPALGRKDTHNTYLALATELGLPGLLLWLVMIFVAFRSNIANKRLLADQDIYVARSWISRALFGFLVAGIFGSYSALNILYLVLGIMSCSTAAREN